MKGNILIGVLIAILIYAGGLGFLAYQKSVHFHEYVKNGEQRYQNANYEEALYEYQKAYSLKQTEELQEQILLTQQQIHELIADPDYPEKSPEAAFLEYWIAYQLKPNQEATLWRLVKVLGHEAHLKSITD